MFVLVCIRLVYLLLQADKSNTNNIIYDTNNIIYENADMITRDFLYQMLKWKINHFMIYLTISNLYIKMYKNSSFVTTRNINIKLIMEKYHLKIKSNVVKSVLSIWKKLKITFRKTKELLPENL